MASVTPIEWTDATWNPIVGCSVTSPGCTNCYAMQMAARIEKMFNGQTHYAGTTKKTKAGPVFTGKVALAPEHILDQPWRWRKPRRIFVNSMGDLFHDNVPDAWIDRVFLEMSRSSAKRHTFQVLTKRAKRMRDYLSRFRPDEDGFITRDGVRALGEHPRGWPVFNPDRWPLPNVWLGVSTEDQQRADERIPHLLNTPAAIRFISAEPLLGPIDLTRIDNTDHGFDFTDALRGERRLLHPSATKGNVKPTERLHWVIAGGESGRNARPMHPDWVRSLRDQCDAAEVPFFFKQWGEWAPQHALPEEPSDALYGEFHGGTDWVHSCLCSEGDGGLFKVGKKKAGNTLDGRQHLAFPHPEPVEGPQHGSPIKSGMTE